jgi:hypothetical protein
MVAKATQKTPGRPAGKRNTLARATGLIQLRLPKEDHAALQREAKRQGTTLTSWMREAAKEALLLAQERVFDSRLHRIESQTEGAAKTAATIANRVENLFGALTRVEQAAVSRDTDQKGKIAALETFLEAQEAELRMALMALVGLLHATPPEHRKWLLEAHQEGHTAGKLYTWLLDQSLKAK